jgi:hypothetical protein
MPISPTIPATQLVAVNPSVLSAGGNAVNLNGLMLTNSYRAPIGSVLQLATAIDVQDYFGTSSPEAAAAAVYFAGFTGCTALPGALLISQYPTASVSAYLRGGSVSALTLTQLKAFTGNLTVTIDGTPVTGSNINLSAATSFSNAAEIIGAGLGIKGTTIGTVTGSIGGTFTATTSGTNLTVSAVLTGSLQTSDVISGTDGTNSLQAGTTIVSQTSGTPGGTGVYVISHAASPGNLGSCTVTSLSNTLNVTVDASTAIGSSDVVSGSSVTANTYIVQQLSGTAGGVGLYQVSNSMTVSSETMTISNPGVTYDSVQDAFTIWSGTTGGTSTMGYASGTLATDLDLTLALGAVTSQGAAAYTPAAAMNAIVTATTNWAGFMTLFDPDGGSGNAQKLLFAEWASGQNNRYFYAAWDTDITPTETLPATSSLGYILAQDNLSGTIPIYEPSDLHHAAFVLGWAASVNFNVTNGRATLAYRGQAGLQPSVTNGSVAQNLIGNNYNFVGDYSLNDTDFTLFQPGSISGPFKWADSYINQIWMNAQFQLALLTFLSNVNSVPYNAAGNAQISQVLASPIQAAVNAGVITPGVTLSGAQIAEVNAAAGANIANTLQTRGWYLQIGISSPSTRAARSTPPITFWYCDGGSVQQITLGSIALQ